MPQRGGPAMNIELPSTRPYGALFAVGSRRSGSATEEIGSIIVKAGYLLEETTGAQTHVMTPDTAASASAMVLTDQGAIDPDDGMDVTREADIAPFKPMADIVVEAFVSDLAGNTAAVTVDGVSWLTRDAGTPPLDGFYLADRGRNLFGYQPRSLTPRKGEAGNPAGMVVPDPFDPDEFDGPDDPVLLDEIAGYDNRVLNFHRRGGGFSATGSIAAALTAGQRVAVLKNGAEEFSVILAHPPLTALYRIYCGTGPDKPPYWKRRRLGAMQADTLILRPNSGTAEVIWRSVWRWADETGDSYRAIRIGEGAI
jgi:hypothetical protein